MGVLLQIIIKMKVVLAVLLLVAAASAAPWGVLPYSGLTSAGVIPYSAGLTSGILPYTGLTHSAYTAGLPLTYAAGSAIPIDGGYPYTDALGFSTGLTNAGARVATYAGAYHHLPISTTVVK